jgi:cytochrome d ubiquinol oxidase subunit II
MVLVGLIFRGVAFEFRFKAEAGKRRMWDKLCRGLITATFFQGVALGGSIDGIAMVTAVSMGARSTG